MIWCIEDDASIRDIEVYALNSTGLKARGFFNGGTLFSELEKERPELIVLDVMLPGTDGTELLKRLKSSKEYADIPVVMATAKGAEYDKIQALDLGADYYITKPFGVMEFVSCVKAVLRRCAPKTAESENKKVLTFGKISLDKEKHTVSANNTPVELTYKEFEILKLFLTHPGTVFTRDSLFNSVWGEDWCGETRTVDMHIKTLRKKLGECGEAIETVRGVGYRLGDNRDR